MSEQDPGRLADQFEREAADLESRGAELGQQIDETRQEWESKRASGAVPGANPPGGEPREGDTGRESETAESPGPEAPPVQPGGP